MLTFQKSSESVKKEEKVKDPSKNSTVDKIKKKMKSDKESNKKDEMGKEEVFFKKSLLL